MISGETTTTTTKKNKDYINFIDRCHRSMSSI